MPDQKRPDSPLPDNTELSASLRSYTSKAAHIKNYGTRHIGVTKQVGGAFLQPTITGLETQSGLIALDNPNAFLVIAMTCANFAALLFGKFIHLICQYYDLYVPTKSLNPFYRVFKTCAVFLAALATIIFIMMSPAAVTGIQIGVALYAGISVLGAGLFAVLYRKYRQSLPKGKPKNTYTMVGEEDWTKNLKTALVGGTSVGQGLAGYYSYLTNCDYITCWTNITLWGAVGGVVSFAACVVLIPTINYFTRDESKKGPQGILVTDNHKWRNNYARTGMNAGMCLGTALGGLLAPTLFVGLSATAGMAIGAAIFAVIGGVALSVYGHKITRALEKHWGVPADDRLNQNPWCFATNTFRYVFSFVGTAVACIFCPGAAILQSAAIGSAISGLFGWFAAFGIIYKARKLQPDESQTVASTVPWTQRTPIGAIEGSSTGAAFGLLLGFVFSGGGGLLVLAGYVTLYGALGGIAGAAYRGLNDGVIWNVYLAKKSVPIVTSETAQQNLTKTISPTPSLSRKGSSSNILGDLESSSPVSSTASTNSSADNTPTSPTSPRRLSFDNSTATNRYQLLPPPSPKSFLQTQAPHMGITPATVLLVQ